MQYRTLYSEIRRNNVETWNIRNIVTSPGQYDSAQNLLRWRADDIRPYMAYATELPSGDFGALMKF